MEKPAKTDKDYEKLGRMLVDIQESVVKPGKGYYRSAFLRGIISGFGGVIGATLLVAFMIWFLSFFNAVPFIGNFVDTIQNSLNSVK